MAALLLEAGVVFAVLAAGATLAARVDQSVIPAYIVAGVLVGPHAPSVGGVSFALVETREFVTLLSELGLVLLLFFIGLEFSFGRLLAARRQAARAGAIDLAINFLAGLALGFLLGLPPLAALFLAGVVYVSSSAVITKSLVELGWIADPESEAILGVLVVEDLVVAVYLALLAAVAVGGGSLWGVGSALGRAGAVLAALVVLATYGTGFLERFFDARSDEVFVLRVVAAAVLVGGVALAAGVSEAVAAFFLGAAIGATSHVERVERLVVSERDIYAAVFFFSIGLATDPRVVWGVLPPVLVLAVVTTGTKLISGYLGGRSYGLTERRSLRAALAMVARGEFSLVLASLAASVPGGGVALTETVPALAVGYVLLMSVLGTVLMRYAPAIERRAGLA